MIDPIWTPIHDPNPVDQALRVIERCRALSKFSESTEGITRTFLSPPMHDVHGALGSWMSELGMESSIDPAGNLHGLYRATHPGPARRLIIGSHLDTVPNAGAYDGILGVVLGGALVEALCGRRFSYEIEVIGFSEEEGVRFGVPFLGSRAWVGTWTNHLFDRTDRNGVTLRQAVADFGLRPEGIPSATYVNAAPSAYLEFHIEQGPVLESLNLPLGIVEAIVGQSRYSVRFEGQANHAGTTPMHLRADALACAAEWIGEVERIGRGTAGLVATVGRLQVSPNAGNVVPGLTEASLDVRHAADAVRLHAVALLLDTANAIAQRRGLRFSADRLLDQAAVQCDSRLTAILQRAVTTAGYAAHPIHSGAGHDAMMVAPIMPITMLFLRSPGGISHHPSETVLASDVAAAIETGICFLNELEKDF